jgi:hypothetical protein
MITRFLKLLIIMKMKSKKQKVVYWNKKQKAFLQAKQSRKVIVGGRGFGKTSIDAGEQHKRAYHLPRSSSFLVAATYNQLLTKTLPTIEAKLKELGWKEGLHYVIGRKPPKHFETPLRPPRRYENIFSTVSGYYSECISMDNAQTARGGSFQSGSVDEMLNLKQDDYTQVIAPSIRTSGSDHFFKGRPCFKQVCFYTSLPRKTSADWIYNYEKWAESDPENFYWLEATSWDNIDILGEDTLKMWEKEMPYIEYQIEVMNRRLKVVESAFYHKLSRDTHTYNVKYLYDIGERGWETKYTIDPNYRDDELIEWSMDFGGWINTSLVMQERKGYEYVLDYVYVPDVEGKVDELIEKFCLRFAKHKRKIVRLWGERMGVAKQVLIKGHIFDYIANKLREKGWVVDIRAKIDNTKDHKIRRSFVDDCFREGEGRNAILPRLRINEVACKDFIIALETTNTNADGSKDKSKERDRSYPQELATHATDAFDYYLIQKYAERVTGRGKRGSSVSFGD